MSRVAATASSHAFRAGDLNEDERTIMQGAMDMKVKTAREVMTGVDIKILRRVRSMAWRCRFLTARPSQCTRRTG